jgi:hypothetical protein
MPSLLDHLQELVAPSPEGMKRKLFLKMLVDGSVK